MLKVVLDTNVILNVLPTWSPNRIILDALFRGDDFAKLLREKEAPQ